MKLKLLDIACTTFTPYCLHASLWWASGDRPGPAVVLVFLIKFSTPDLELLVQNAHTSHKAYTIEGVKPVALVSSFLGRQRIR